MATTPFLVSTFTALAIAICSTSSAMAVDSQRTPSPRLEVAFEPEAGAEALVLNVLASATRSIRLSAFALSSPAIIGALVRAKNHGIDVQVVVDHHHNVEDDPKGIGRRALATLAEVGIPARTNSSHRILHDKFIVVDSLHIQTGSYNYALSANANSENVLVIWNDVDLAWRYLQHWQSRFDGGPLLRKDEFQ